MQDDHNPYEAPRVSLASNNEFSAILSEEELATFSNQISENQVGYYPGRFRKSLDGGSLGFNGAAFMFGSNWCFWRKLFRVGALLLVVEVVTSIAAGIGFLVIMGDAFLESSAFAISSFLVLFGMVRLPFGMWANRFYLRMAAREATNARAKADSPDEATSILTRRGGTSGVGLAVGLAISFALRLLSELAL